MTVINTSSTRIRFRRSGSVWIAAILTLVFVMPFATSVFVELTSTARLLLAPVAIIAVAVPLLIAIWSLRSGVDVTTEGLVVKALLGSRRIAWSTVKGFDTDGGKVYVLLDGGVRLALATVRAEDLPRLVAASGSELRDSAAEDQ